MTKEEIHCHHQQRDKSGACLICVEWDKFFTEQFFDSLWTLPEGIAKEMADCCNAKLTASLLEKIRGK